MEPRGQWVILVTYINRPWYFLGLIERTKTLECISPENCLHTEALKFYHGFFTCKGVHQVKIMTLEEYNEDRFSAHT